MSAEELQQRWAVVPDDMPTVSALTSEERDKVLSSMGNDDKSSIAGSEDAKPPAPRHKPIKRITRNKTPQEPPVKKARRSHRCGQCPSCQVPEDCGICTNCLDKPKFGGRNIKKQCCKMRKCQNLQWRPSKAYLQKQAKGSMQNKQKKLATRLGVLPRSKSNEKDKPLAPSKPDMNFNLLNTLCNGTIFRQKTPSDGVHRFYVEFKDCEVGNVWEMGGLSILTTVLITPCVVCILCASSGNVEFVYCQVCCEPFHRFCLEEWERPSEDQLENWCCRNCKFCHVCGRHQQANKLLECNKCCNSYHPECLGLNYPTKHTKKNRAWICTKCIRCKSCGSTTPGKGSDAQWSHDFSLCHDCAKLFAKGNFCPLCNKCYDDDDYETKMMQCGKCDCWVHSKCENLTDEMYEILSNLPESVAYTCINCTEHHPAEWRLALTTEFQASIKYVLTALLNSRTSSHLLRYRQAANPLDLNPEPEENMSFRSSPEGPDPPVLTQVDKQDEQPPLDLEGVKKKMEDGRYTFVLEMSDDIVRIIQAAMNADGGQPELKKANSMVKSFFTKQMERVFPWFSVKKSRFWEPNKVNSNSSMSPNAVLPPSLDHNYAQWQERESRLAVQPPLMKKIIPAPKPKSPGDPESPQPVQSSTPPATDHSREEIPELPPPQCVEDNRQCALCLKYGDDNANDAGRLLYIGQDEWTHINCALWSAEVFEDDGSLKNVHMAVIRGKQLRCEHCLKLGATVGCYLTFCKSNYHFMCSRIKSCVFLEDKKVYCQKHRDLIKGEIVSDNSFKVFRRAFVDFEGINLRRKFLNGLVLDNVHMMIGSMTIDCLGILSDLSDCDEKLFPIGYQCSRIYWSTTVARKRCVYTFKILECRPPPTEPDINNTVHHEENRTIVHSPPLSGMHGGPVTHEIVTVGNPLLSSGLRSIGSCRQSPAILDLEPPTKEQSQEEPKQDDSREDCKQPEDDGGFSSPLMRLLQHEHRHQDSLQLPKPRTGLLFEISSDDGFQISANSIEEAWKYLTDKVQEARSNARLKQLSFAGVNGLKMLGIIHDAVVFLMEQLYGANKCHSYKFRFHHPAGEEEPPLNPHGAARAEMHRRKSTFNMFNFLASKHRQPPEYKPNDKEDEVGQLKSVRRATSIDLPMPMRFRHLTKTSKEAVGVYRSPIHGLGLFCKRNIDAGEMVIEYCGKIIRSILTDKREKYNDGKGIGCYMFRIDDSEVVDATMHGNAARFINHSCEPNCYSRVIPIDGQKHIVIFAMRKICRGEELTYDYKFPIEDASNKIACNCGTKKCRKFLN